MDPAEHTAQIQYFIQQFRGPDAAEASRKFAKFIYFHANRKIRQALEHPLLVLFTEGAIDDQDLREGMPTGEVDAYVTPKMLRHGDLWLKDLWVCAIKQRPRFGKADRRNHLVYNSTCAVGLQRLLCHIFRLLSDELAVISHAWKNCRNPSHVNKKYLETVESSLYGVGFYLDFFDSLLKSPVFWRHMAHPVLQEWVYRQYSDSKVRLAPSITLHCN